MKRIFRILIAAIFLISCKDTGTEAPGVRTSIATDLDLFTLVTVGDSYTAYRLFPGVDSLVSGTLNGSTAHRPIVRVSLNNVAQGVLNEGRLTPGTSFPDGSVIFKEIRMNDATTLFAVMYKDQNNPLSAGGWLWSEMEPDGTPFYSVQNKGKGCIGCHGLERGAQNDLVRTFERRTGP